MKIKINNDVDYIDVLSVEKLEFNENEINFVVGKNNSGKSQLLNLLSKQKYDSDGNEINAMIFRHKLNDFNNIQNYLDLSLKLDDKLIKQETINSSIGGEVLNRKDVNLTLKTHGINGDVIVSDGVDKISFMHLIKERMIDLNNKMIMREFEGENLNILIKSLTNNSIDSSIIEGMYNFALRNEDIFFDFSEKISSTFSEDEFEQSEMNIENFKLIFNEQFEVIRDSLDYWKMKEFNRFIHYFKDFKVAEMNCVNTFDKAVLGMFDISNTYVQKLNLEIFERKKNIKYLFSLNENNYFKTFVFKNLVNHLTSKNKTKQLIMIDEPENSLDWRNLIEMNKIINEINSFDNKIISITWILSTHSPKLISLAKNSKFDIKIIYPIKKDNMISYNKFIFSTEEEYNFLFKGFTNYDIFFSRDVVFLEGISDYFIFNELKNNIKDERNSFYQRASIIFIKGTENIEKAYEFTLKNIDAFDKVVFITDNDKNPNNVRTVKQSEIIEGGLTFDNESILKDINKFEFYDKWKSNETKDWYFEYLNDFKSIDELVRSKIIFLSHGHNGIEDFIISKQIQHDKNCNSINKFNFLDKSDKSNLILQPKILDYIIDNADSLLSELSIIINDEKTYKFISKIMKKEHVKFENYENSYHLQSKSKTNFLNLTYKLNFVGEMATFVDKIKICSLYKIES